MNLSDQEFRIISEEEDNLRKLQLAYAGQLKSTLRDDIIREITDLNELIPEVNTDDLPQVKAQLNRLDAVLRQIDLANDGSLDIMNPYFGHMRLADKSGIKDLYLGTYVFRAGKGGLQVIDWKTSPISRIYFLYDEGDEYEEEIEGRLFEGEVVFKRILRIVDGVIREIQTGDKLFRRNKLEKWEIADASRYLLRGGAGSASRPLNTVSINPKLGIREDAGIRNSKYLPEITGMIDPEQFELITQPESGVVAIQGVAGSGKTTVALHRVAWLHFQDKQRFRSESILVIVFNRALSNYISKVLPSLGVEHVQIENFESWISSIRQRVFSGKLPKAYSEQTPVSVIRFKKHPKLFRLLNQYILDKETQFEEGLFDLLGNSDLRALIKELQALPLITRIYNFYEWLEGKRIIENFRPEFNTVTRSKLYKLVQKMIDPEKDRMTTFIEYWEDFFTDYQNLESAFHGESEEFTDIQMLEIKNWIKHQFAELGQAEPVSKKDLVNLMSEDKSAKTEGATLDYEDDPILVYFYQRLLKNIEKKNKKKLLFDHIMIDEVQDFSPVELAVLLNIAKQPLSLTLAGDTNQKMIRETGFKTWESTFETLNIKGQKVSALNIGYRSTFEIMDYSIRILGDLADAKEFIATRHGPPVDAFQFANQGEMIQFLSKSLVETTTYEPMASIALICPDPDVAREYYHLLKAVEIADLRLIDDQNFPFTPGIDVTDVRQVKGLEFDYVLLIEVDQDYYRNDAYSKYLLHIAASRAAHQLWILNYRTPSQLLPK